MFNKGLWDLGAVPVFPSEAHLLCDFLSMDRDD